jgi:DNA (cytosine-5)-methyltransferase 1
MGWKPVGFSEIEKFPSQVLAHHYPTVTNFGDMTKYKEWNLNDSIGLLVGGTPCQSFSVAGLRKGLDDPRGNLALTYVGILDKFRPKWCIWENVPGVLSSGGGRDFGSFLGALDELGYGWAYRVLDAQNFGVAQRRRRVFVVGHLGDWKPAAEVLFESESLRGDIKKGRGKGKDIANCLTKSPSSHSSFNPARGEGNGVVVKWFADTASTLNASFGEKLGLENQHINSGAPLFVQAVYENHAQDSRVKEVSVSPTVAAKWGTGGGNVPIAIQGNLIGRDKGGPQGIGVSDSETMYTLTKADVHGVAFAQNQLGEVRENNVFNTLNTNSNASGRNTPLLRQHLAVRRLTPVECERLQGFPDNYTNIPKAADGNRYKALGNSMAVPVMRWIGERINQYEQRGVEKHL